jgi:sugar phosphate isomerase/epimerase
MIFISTGGYAKVPAFETAKTFFDHGIAKIELSGGLYDENQLAMLKKMKSSVVFRIHNYFPPPLKSFVLNLASLDKEIAVMSLNHVLRAMEWAVKLDQPIYSFHAGFLFDPQPRELGKPIPKYNLVSREAALNVFIDRVASLSERAKRLGVQLLVENNVLSLKNYHNFRQDAFLMTTPEEAIIIMKNTPDNVNLLIDVAHLKVSAQTLGYNPVTMLTQCEQWIQAYHLSDNDGTQDSNDAISENSYFWPYIKKDLNYYSLEIYRVSEDTLLLQKQLVQRKLGKY